MNDEQLQLPLCNWFELKSITGGLWRMSYLVRARFYQVTLHSYIVDSPVQTILLNSSLLTLVCTNETSNLKGRIVFGVLIRKRHISNHT